MSANSVPAEAGSGYTFNPVPNFLDSCLSRNDGLFRNKLSDCSIITSWKSCHPENRIDFSCTNFAAGNICNVDEGHLSAIGSTLQTAPAASMAF
jgi:hypothetical protein